MRILILLLITIWLVNGCKAPSNNSPVVSNDTVQYEQNTLIAKEEAGNSNCDFKDGSHSASVEYHNPKTKHTAQYELEVHVKDCKIVQIDFPNGGRLDKDHISPTPINGNKEAELQDDKGRTWKIHLR